MRGGRAGGHTRRMSGRRETPGVGGAGFDAADPRSRRFFLVLAYAVLALSTAVALVFDDEAAARPGPVLGLAALAAAWLPLLGLAAGRRRPALAYYAGLLALGAALGAVSPLFGLFASIGYPLAFTLFPPRWSIAAVTVTAMVNVVAQGHGGPAAYTPLLAVALPLVFAGLFVGAESERRKALVAELTAANGRLEDALAENAALQARLVGQAREAGIAAERQRMAREIHDTISQGLIALITQLRAAVAAPPGSDRARRHLETVESLAHQTLTEARRSVRALRPEPLERSRLPAALAELAERWSAASGVPVTVEITGETTGEDPADGGARPLPAAVEVALFRVAQEALANVARHARASRAGLTLSYLDDVVLLDIRDDGVGFDPGAGGAGFGLGSMRQRVAEAGGTLEIESAPGQGTAIAVSVPMTDDVRRAE